MKTFQFSPSEFLPGRVVWKNGRLHGPNTQHDEFAELIDDLSSEMVNQEEKLDEGNEANVRTVRRYLEALVKNQTSRSQAIVLPTKREIDAGLFERKPVKVDEYIKRKLEFLRVEYKYKYLKFRFEDSIITGYADELRIDKDGFYLLVEDKEGREYKVRESQIIRVISDQTSTSAAA